MLFALVLMLAAPPSPEVEAAKKQLRALERKYSIDIQWEFAFLEEKPGWTVSTRVPRPEDLVEFTPMLEKMMAIYPDKVWKSGKVKTVVLAKQCLRNGVSWAGIAVPARQALLIDVEKARNDAATRETFHHELYHLLDPISDEAWDALNVRNFSYRPIDKPRTKWVEDERREGFASSYARTSSGEDRAELFAKLVEKPKDTAQRMKADDVLRAKADKIREATSAYGLDAAWWKKRAP